LINAHLYSPFDLVFSDNSLVKNISQDHTKHCARMQAC